MATAKVTRKDGTTVNIEGTPEEVAALVQRISPADGAATRGTSRRRSKPAPRKSKAKEPTNKPMGPVDYIRELIESDFFASKRGLGEIKAKLDEQAHFYPVTSLSPAVIRLVRRRELRRLKEGGTWKYVNP
jgi:hypothetical protein